MKHLTGILLTLVLGLSAAQGADEKPGRERGERRGPDPERAFKRLDANSDGKVTLEEFKAGPAGKRDATKAEEIFKKIDADGSGDVTLEEFKAHVPRRGERGGDKPRRE